MLLIFKILLVPIIIAIISLVSRIWGTAVSGLLGGLPIIVGPILVFLAVENGVAFAQASAQAALAGVISIGLFSFLYAIATQKFGVKLSSVIGLSGFFAASCCLFFINLSLLHTLILTIICLTTYLIFFPRFSSEGATYQITIQDVLLRMLASAILILLLTYCANLLGSRLTGLLAPFPIAGIILAGFTHYYSGADSARKLLYGFIQGLFGMAIFNYIFAIFLPQFGITTTVLTGVGISIFSSNLIRILVKKFN